MSRGRWNIIHTVISVVLVGYIQEAFWVTQKINPSSHEIALEAGAKQMPIGCGLSTAPLPQLKKGHYKTLTSPCFTEQSELFLGGEFYYRFVRGFKRNAGTGTKRKHSAPWNAGGGRLTFCSNARRATSLVARGGCICMTKSTATI